MSETTDVGLLALRRRLERGESISIRQTIALCDALDDRRTDIEQVVLEVLARRELRFPLMLGDRPTGVFTTERITTADARAIARDLARALTEDWKQDR